MRLLVVLLTTLLLACTQSSPAPIPAAGASITGTVVGTVVERVDGAPYSYLRLKTEQGFGGGLAVIHFATA